MGDSTIAAVACICLIRDRHWYRWALCSTSWPIQIIAKYLLSWTLKQAWLPSLYLRLYLCGGTILHRRHRESVASLIFIGNSLRGNRGLRLFLRVKVACRFCRTLIEARSFVKGVDWIKMLARRLERALWASTLVCKLAFHAGSCDLELSQAFGLCVVCIYWLSMRKERCSTTWLTSKHRGCIVRSSDLRWSIPGVDSWTQVFVLNQKILLLLNQILILVIQQILVRSWRWALLSWRTLLIGKVFRLRHEECSLFAFHYWTLISKIASLSLYS